MSFYSERKFRALSEQRKTKVMLDLVCQIEKSWENLPLKNDLLSDLQHCFLWLELADPDGQLSRIVRLKSYFNEDFNRRHLLNITLFLERSLSLSGLDENPFEVTSRDQPQGNRRWAPLFVVLDHLRSAFNVGSIFRSSECLGVQHIYLIGYTPTPQEKAVQKTAMGTESLVGWSQHESIDPVINQLRQQGVSCIALETSEQAQDLYQFEVSSSAAVILGNERFGLDHNVLEQADHLLRIPMAGWKNSLNVANSFGIVGFELLRQWQLK